MQSGEKGGDGSFESQYPELDASLLKLQGCAMDNLKRLDDLRRAIANLREGIGPSKELVWPQLLAKFQVVSKTYLALSQTLIQAMTSANLGDFALVPKAAPSDPEAVSELLRTKIDIPESTEEEGIRDLESMDKEAIAKRIQGYNTHIEAVQRNMETMRREFTTSGKDLPSLDADHGARSGGQPDLKLIQMVQRGTGLS
mmetsp:Transcript_42938/g.167875  ORF Transcript_42938/g.167875 Transcript_42938/m.167875 type:complete len:199 (+) Transcript_42938:125-721(+)